MMSSLTNQTLADEGNPEFDRDEDIEIVMNIAIFATWLAACTTLAAGMSATAWRKLQGLVQARAHVLAAESSSEYQELPGAVAE